METATRGCGYRKFTVQRTGAALILCLGLLASFSAGAFSFHARGSDHAGRSPQGYLGINFRDVGDEQASTLKLKDARGEEVILVDHDGPACKAGLREHDVLTQMNGQPIDGEESLRRTLHDLPPGRSITFTFSREGQLQTLSIQLANRDTVGQEAWDHHITVPEPSAPGPSAAIAAPSGGPQTRGFFGHGGPTAADLPKHGLLGSAILSASYTGALLELMGPQLADYFGAQTGLLVRAVDPASPAAAAGMRAGDVVVKINALPVVSGTDWVKTVHENRGRPIAVVVLREKKEQILTLIPDTKKRSSMTLPPFPAVAPAPELAVGMVTLPGRIE